MADEPPTSPPAGSGPGGAGRQSPGSGGFGQSRYGLDPDDTPTVPKLFAQGDVPAGFWDGPPPDQRRSTQQQAAEAAAAAQSWPADQTPPAGPQQVGAAEPPAGAVVYAAPVEEHPRRRALIGVALVALATVLVVVAALVIGPHLGSSEADGDGDQQAAPPQTPASTSRASGTPTPSESIPVAPVVPPTDSDASSAPGAASGTGTAGSHDAGADPGSGTGSGSTPESTSVVTVTVTASDDGSTRPNRTATDTRRTSSGRTTSSSAAPSTTTSTKTSASTTPSKYGVPVEQISCSDGYIVQLASELTSSAFTHRVAELKQQGLVPSDAKAADSTKSCRLFTNQTNTLILYAGPFEGRYDACGDRLAGPYDAFIRGANPDTSGEFVSCICPARVRNLPTVSRVGTTDQWVGELQRMLAAHLRYSIPDLGIGSWGQYTPDTRAAVQRFQSDYGLRDTGRVDSRTWRALQRAGC